MSATPVPEAPSHRRKLSGEERRLLIRQTYAPASLINQPRELRSYMLLHSEFGSGAWGSPMSAIAAALDVTERSARDRVTALEATGSLEVKRRAGQQSKYRLVQEDQYIEMPLEIVLGSNHAVCAVWAALRRALGRGCSALTRVTATVEMPWARIQAMTGLCRTAVAEALRWLLKQKWLSRRVVWASFDPIRRAVCRWTLRLRMRTPEKSRTPPRQEPGQPPSGGRRDRVKPQADLVTSPERDEGSGEKAARLARESGAEGVDVFAVWRSSLTR